MPQQKLPTILIINTSEDYLDIMRLFLNAEGYVTIPLKITEIKAGNVDVVSIIQDNDPKVILYDIAFPYIENWRQFRNISQLDICKNREFVLTTPNIDALVQQIGEQVSAYQIVDKEIDLQKIVTHVNQVWDKLNSNKTKN